MYKINDEGLLVDLASFKEVINENKQKLSLEKDGRRMPEHPLDEDVVKLLEQLKSGIKGESIEYSQAKNLDELWRMLIDKSIKCLRYFDKREPFYEDAEKKPFSYGIDKLCEYHDRYADFESLLYGSSFHYRDHVFHAFRTWMLGIFCLIKNLNVDEGLLIDHITIDGLSRDASDGDRPAAAEFDMNFFEKLSMWTIIALCHDLGYPLEKSQHILDKTKDMMREFIPNPNIWNNFSFSGVQNNINDYIVRFISTKMVPVEGENGGVDAYHGRVQPKYYLKFSKSLEHFDHGIISSVIIYKMLLYFMESDFNMNDDYMYGKEDARQFYIRREILRAMASHTCQDVYNIYLTTFSSILFLCDEFQEWGRKSWNELYLGVSSSPVELSIESFDAKSVSAIENVEAKIESEEELTDSINAIFMGQYYKYNETFRDGQYTKNRDFNLKRRITINLKHSGTAENQVQIEYELGAEGGNHFKIDLTKSGKFCNCEEKIRRRLNVHGDIASDVEF